MGALALCLACLVVAFGVRTSGYAQSGEGDGALDRALDVLQALSGSGEGTDGSGEGPAAEVNDAGAAGDAAQAAPVLHGPTLDAQRFADAVIARANGMTPRPRDSRVAILVDGQLTPESAEALGVSLAELTSASAIDVRITGFEEQLHAQEIEVALMRSSRRWFVRYANTAFNALAEGNSDPYLAARMAVFREMASVQATRLDGLEAEQQFLTAALYFLRARAEALEKAENDETLVAEVAEQTDEIVAERERLQEATAVTAAMAERAREAEQRARSERDTANDESVTARWEALAPRLRRVVDARTREQEFIAAATLRREQLATEQSERAALLREVLSEQDRELRAAGADQLLDVLVAARVEIRASAQERRRNVAEVEASLREAQQAVIDKERELERAEAAAIGLPTERRVQLREVGAEELRVLEEERGLAELRHDTAASLWRLNESQISFYGRTIDELVPHISSTRRRELFRISPANLVEARRNLGERIFGLSLRVDGLLKHRDDLPAASASQERNLLRVGVMLVLLLVFVRLFPKYRDPIILQVLELRKLPRLRRMTPLIVKLGEVIHEALDEATVAVGLYAASLALVDYPTLHMVVVWFFWVAAYRFIIGVLRTIVLPRGARDPVMIGEVPDQVRLGVDLFSHDARRGALILRSARLVLLYLVAGRVGLAAVRVVFGPGFFFYWIGWLFNLALLALVYAIAWYWRAEIVAAFVERTGEQSKKLADWVTEHQGKFYSVLVVIGLGIFVILTWVLRLLGTWLSGRGIGRFVANFAVRKKLERAAGDAATAEAVKKTVLPVAYQRVFRDDALADEEYLISRPEELAAVTAAFESWQQDASHGRTVAITGDAGAGKTTFGATVALTLAKIPVPLTGVAARKAAAAEAAAEAKAKAEEAESNAAADIMEELAGGGDEAADTEATATAVVPDKKVAANGGAKGQANDASAEPVVTREVLRVAVVDKLLTAEAVLAWMRTTFSLECALERDAILAALAEREPCAVVVDQCENLFLRVVGGFAGVDEFLDICALSNRRVFWVLTFDRHPWTYLHRVRDRKGYFHEIVPLKPFTPERLQEMIEARNKVVGVHPNFDRLVGDGTSDTQYYELVKTAGGYYRLLAEYSRGNLRVALYFWLQSLIKEPSGEVYVTLFARPDAKGIKAMSDEYLFALTALVQHRALSVAELSQTLDVPTKSGAVTVNLLREKGYVQSCEGDRVRIATHMYFVVVNRLREENFLHLT